MKYCIERIRSVIFLLLLMKAQGVEQQTGQLENEESTQRIYVEQNPKLVEVRAGWEVTLNCGIRNEHAEFLIASDVFWFFKSCGEGINQISCKSYEIQSSDWLPIDCGSHPCKASLNLKNPSARDNGLFRCKIQPYKTDRQTLNIQLIKTFKLEVIDSSPELLDDLPANVTSFLEGQVVLQCKVSSKAPISIKWFKKRKDSMYHALNNHALFASSLSNSFYRVNPRAISYFESTYELIESNGVKSLSDDTFLSKLIINNVQEKDAGVYVCVGINYRGFKMQEAYVNVVATNIDNISLIQSGFKSTLIFLFLLPILLAILPICGYTCYLVISRNIFNKSRLKKDVNVIRCKPNNDRQRKFRLKHEIVV